MSAAAAGRVLVVDDEPHILRALQWLLEREFEVHACDCPERAAELLACHDFDVVMSDQRMPAMSGIELLRRVREQAPRAMRMLLTGYSDLDALVKSVNEGEVFRFVTKPWDVHALPRLVRRAVEAARATVPVALRAGGAAEAVLAIDDDEALHRAVDEAAPLETLHARDLPAALSILDRRAVAVIVSEARVRGTDATRLLRLVKAARPEVVTVVATARRDAQTLARLINEGQVFRLLDKPVAAPVLAGVLGAALERHRELAANPAAVGRVAVEPLDPAEAEALYRDIIAAGIAPAGGGADRRARHADGLTAGFRRLFGTR